MSGYGGWAWYRSLHNKEMHYLPLDDDRIHVLVGKACWCNPFQEIDGIVHNAADEREKFELGWRKPN